MGNKINISFLLGGIAGGYFVNHNDPANITTWIAAFCFGAILGIVKKYGKVNHGEKIKLQAQEK